LVGIHPDPSSLSTGQHYHGSLGSPTISSAAPTTPSPTHPPPPRPRAAAFADIAPPGQLDGRVGHRVLVCHASPVPRRGSILQFSTSASRSS